MYKSISLSMQPNEVILSQEFKLVTAVSVVLELSQWT